MRIFRSEIETALKIMGSRADQPHPAARRLDTSSASRRAPANVACAYRIKEVARQTPMIATLEYRRDACVALAGWASTSTCRARSRRASRYPTR